MNKHSVFTSTVLLFLSLICIYCTDQAENQDVSRQDNYTESSGANLTSVVIDSTINSATTVQPKPRGVQPQNTTASIPKSRQTAITRAVQKVSSAVVSITVTEVVQGGRRPVYNEFYNRFFSVPIEREVSSMGSGFIIDSNGLIVTNQHVANENAKKVVVSLMDGSQYDARVLGSDELADLALLKIEANENFPAVEFGNSDSVMVGEWSLAIGNPFGLFEAAQPSVTVGVVSAMNRDFRPNPNEPRVYTDMIQTDAAINRGNSGGPLVDSEGKVIGINTFIFTGGTSNGFVGLGFAIPSNRVQKIIKQLAASGQVSVPFNTGMQTEEMTYQLMRKYNLPHYPGLLVTTVNKDGPAFEAGVVPGDIILKVGEERVQSQMHMNALFREYAEGDSMRVQLLRKGKRYEAKMKLRRKVTE